MKKIFIFLLTMLISVIVFSQDTDSAKQTSPAPTITGSIDAYYRYNFNNPKSGATNNLTSFTNSQNSFE